jgi:hypothetical protein
MGEMNTHISFGTNETARVGVKRTREDRDEGMFKLKENRYMGPAATGANATEVKRPKVDSVKWGSM